MTEGNLTELEWLATARVDDFASAPRPDVSEDNTILMIIGKSASLMIKAASKKLLREKLFRTFNIRIDSTET